MENVSTSCCLCLTTDSTKNVFNIFDEGSVNKNITSVITKHFWFEIKEQDANKYICAICWSKVDSFHSFYTQVYNIHNEFSKIQKIIKVEMEEEHSLNVCHHISESEKFENTQMNLNLKKKLENEVCKNKTAILIDKVEEDELSEDSNIVDHSDVMNDNNSYKSTSGDDENCGKTFGPRKSKLTINSRKCLMKKVKKDIDSIDKAIDEQNKQIQEYFSMECELCPIRCDTFQNIKLHYRIEHKVKGYLRCCNRKFMKRPSLVEHIERHLNPDTFKCDLCNKNYAHKRSLLEHHKWHLSSENKPFKCTKCSKSFTKKFILENHLATHNNEKKFMCDDCGKSYGTKRLLQAHTKNIHSGANIFICDVCAKEFRSKVVFEQHQKTVHQDIVLPKVQCQVCGIWLKHKHCLRQHMVRHEESKANHFCNICGKQSLNRKSLLNHVKNVHSDKVYNCSLCEKTFKKPKSLKEHMATHTGVTLYSCPYCPKTFNSSANMYSHKKKIHVKEWEEHERLKATGL